MQSDTGQVLVPSTARRPEIQGLRAVAVLMVVAFHAGLPVPGGFVGVDVFFVISGFVITAMLHREVQATGGIGLRRFYRRRFQRITPALALTVVVTLIVSVALLSPLGPLQVAAKTGIGALLLVANFVIARTTGGYFDLPAETNPLLHTWSLSVEEQFYLFFPFVLSASWVLARRHRMLRHAALFSICGIGAVSLGLTLVYARGVTAIGVTWVAGFYSSFTRAWEFAAGALIAILVHHIARTPRALSLALGLAGTAMLVASLWAIDDTTIFPSAWTLLPVVGTAFVIVACVGPTNVIGRLLATRPMVEVGDRSYSIYLWHWPCIVFAAILWPGDSTMLLVAAGVSFLPAFASYRFFEQPIRTLSLPSGRRFARLVAVVMLPAMVCAVAVLALTNRVLEPRYVNGDVAVAFHGAIGWANDSKFSEWFVQPSGLQIDGEVAGFESKCWQSSAGDPEFVIVGDSHSRELFPGFAREMPDVNVMVCDINGFPSGAEAPFSAVYDYVEHSPSVRTVLISNYWRRPPDVPAFKKSLRALRDADKTVYLTDDVPDFPFDPFRCKYRVLAGSMCSIDRDAHDRQRQGYVEQLRAFTKAVHGVEILRTHRYFCNADKCRMTSGNDLLYRDSNHLNYRGSQLLARRVLRDHPEILASLTGTASSA